MWPTSEIPIGTFQANVRSLATGFLIQINTKANTFCFKKMQTTSLAYVIESWRLKEAFDNGRPCLVPFSTCRLQFVLISIRQRTVIPKMIQRPQIIPSEPLPITDALPPVVWDFYPKTPFFAPLLLGLGLGCARFSTAAGGLGGWVLGMAVVVLSLLGKAALVTGGAGIGARMVWLLRVAGAGVAID